MAIGDDLGANLVAALNAAPDLSTAPSLALAAAQQPDPTQAAQGLSFAATNAAANDAVGAVARKVGHPDILHQALGFLGGTFHNVKNELGQAGTDIGGALDAGLKAASAPLREVQHTYRALRDIEYHHGLGAAVLEGLGMAAGGIGGFMVGGGLEGAVLGAEGVGDLSARLFFKDSWDRTANGEAYRIPDDPGLGQVSFGRDVARSLPGPLHVSPGSRPFTVISGALDGLADLFADPVAKVAGIASDVRTANRAATTVADVERNASNPAVARAFAQIAGSTSGEVVASFPKFAGIADRLGAASSVDEVTDVFRNVAQDAELMRRTPGQLPAVNFTRIPFAKLSEFLANYQGVGGERYYDAAGQLTDDVAQAAKDQFGSPITTQRFSAGANAVRKVTSLLPTAIDSDTLALSGKEFDPASADGYQAVYRTLRFGQSRQVAEDVATRFIQADAADRIGIYKNAVIDSLLARGVPDNGEVIRNLRAELADVLPSGHEDLYGFDVEGHSLSSIPTSNGVGSQAAGILANQTGKLAIPNFAAYNREIRALNNGMNLFGGADDWLYAKVTQGIFKPLVLLSGGFAQRIAAAEALPAIMRDGFVNTVQSSVSQMAAKYGYQLEDGQTGHIGAALAKIFGGADRVLNAAGSAGMSAEEVRQLAAAHVASLGGETVTPAVEAGHSISSEAVGHAEAQRQTLYNTVQTTPRMRMRSGDEFVAKSAGDKGQTDFWQAALRETANDPASVAAARAYREAAAAGASPAEATAAGAEAASDYWKAQPPEVLANYKRAQVSSTPGVDPIDDWGRVIMENVKGLTHTPRYLDGAGAVLTEPSPHMDLLSALASAEPGTPGSGVVSKDVLDAIEPADRPLQVKGRTLVPDVEGTVQRIANIGFRRVLDPIINTISREPIYFNELKNEYAPLLPLIEDGTLSPADALQIAQTRATKGMLPFIHNTLEKSQFSIASRNFMPFFFAQQQSYARFGRLLADDPQAFRKFQLLVSAFAESGSTVKDAQGKSYLSYPGTGFLDHAAVNALGGLGVPVAGNTAVRFSGQVKSLGSLFPFSEGASGLRPSMGPLVSIPLHALDNLFPGLTPMSEAAAGPTVAQGSIWDQLIPNAFLKNVVNSFDGSTASFHNSTLATIQDLAYQQDRAMAAWVAAGHKEDDPGHPEIIPAANASAMDRQAFIDRVRNQTTIQFLGKALLGFVTPASPSLDLGETGLRKEVRDLIAAKGLAAGLAEFRAEHPDATAYTVFDSKSQAGANIPATIPAQDFLDAHGAMLAKYPDAGAWLIPQPTDAKFDAAVYNAQLAQHLRVQKAPDQFLQDIYTAAGNAQYYGADKPAFDQFLAQAQASGDRTAVASLRADFDNYLKTVAGAANPVWYDNFTSKDRANQRLRAVTQLQQIFAAGQAPPGKQSDDVAGLLKDYQTYQNAKTAGRLDAYAVESRAQLKADWQSYLDEQAIEFPNLAPVIQSVFRDL